MKANFCHKPVTWVVLAALLIGGLLLWARGRDPFQRQWHTIRVAGGRAAASVAVVPKTASTPMPVVIYFHGSGGSLVGSGNDLRAIAELGIAAVGMDYCQTNQAVFERQFAALIEHVGRQRWADTNRMAWLGYSLGAQRQLAFMLRHPEQRPALLVRLGGGTVPELEVTTEAWRHGETKDDLTGGSRGSGGQNAQSLNGSANGAQFPVTTTLSPGKGRYGRVLIVHGEHDEIFPMEQARAVEGFFRSNGVPVELKLLKGQGHGLGEERMVIFRQLGEDCLGALKGEDAFRDYRSILQWQCAAIPLWVWLVPGGALALILVAADVRRLHLCRFPSLPREREWSLLTSAATGASKVTCKSSLPRLAWFIAFLLAIAAGLQAGIHFTLPRVEASSRTVTLARRFLVQGAERPAFDHLAALPIWKGKHIGSMVEHTHLAQYNRQIINWKIDDSIYRDYVLDPHVDAESDGALDWRRTLWESCYPRIRREERAEAAADVILRHLRARVTIREGDGWPAEVSHVWKKQITNPRGFAALYTAALRSCGVPAQVNGRDAVEVWDGTQWKSERPNQSQTN